MSQPDLSTVLFEVDDHVATLTLNRPDRMNSFNEQMVSEIDQVWREVRTNADIRCVVLRAAGDRAFCTGMDIREGPWWSDLPVFSQEDPGALLGPKSQRVWKPVITAVQGIAAGGAMYLLNESDIIIAAPEATFFDPHASGGMVSALEPIGMLHRGIPLGEVMRWALLGNEERMTAETAQRIGLVTEIVERDRLWAHAAQLAAEIAARRPDGIQGTVRAIWESLDQMPSHAKRTGLSYAQLGNKGSGPQHPAERRAPRLR
jgi:enoyl-CoA hydratase/carnithine racemase